MQQLKVLIIEDEKQIARFLELELLHQGYLVEIANNGEEGLKKVAENPFDLILLDLMLPGLGGVAVCQRIRQFSDVAVIMLTARDDISDVVMGLDAGADDYMTKPFEMDELLARIRATLRRKSDKPSESSIIIVGDLRIDPLRYQVTRNDLKIELTKREFDLLLYLVNNKEIVLSREQILGAVWGYEFLGDTNVVDVYIRYLRSKLEVDESPKLIQTVRGVGYVLRESKDENFS